MSNCLLPGTMAAVVAAVACAAAAAPVVAPTPRFSVKEYHSQADAICAVERQTTMNLVMNARTLAGYLTSEVPVVRAAYASLKALVPPAELASLHAQVVATVHSELTLFISFRARAKAGKLAIPQFENSPQLQRLNKRELALWKKIGASVCSGA